MIFVLQIPFRQGLLGATGSASGPLARVATNSADEAAALAARFLTASRTTGADDGNAAAVSAARDVARDVEQAVSDVTLQRTLGGLTPMEAAEKRTQAYGPWIEAERKRISKFQSAACFSKINLSAPNPSC